MKSNPSSPLLTDLYELTMAYGYWSAGMHEREAVFHLLFRSNPFKGNYALSCGIESVIEYLSGWQFQADELLYLAGLTNVSEEPLFSTDFLNFLSKLKFTCDIDAIPEGTIVFPHAPLLRVEGPLLQCQLIESALLNIINFQTLIATKASRVCLAAGLDPVIEFGLRRAQGPDGSLSASRAAYVGGCRATSNTLAGKLFGIPVRGTHAHSWVTAFPSEREAFAAYAQSMPNNCILLVDTYHTLTGVANAIAVGKTLRSQGKDLLAIRLDSGDLAQLSIKARRLLDEAGFTKTGIFASNSLDEHIIADLKQQGAKISSWGVGTSLVTGFDQPALDGVYKLSAIQDQKGEWQYKLKLSEQEIKISNPGKHQVRRFFFNDQCAADVIYDCWLGIPEMPTSVLLDPAMEKRNFENFDGFIDLLEPVFRRGKLVRKERSIQVIRKLSRQNVSSFVKNQANVIYPVGLEKKLAQLKQDLINKLRKD